MSIRRVDHLGQWTGVAVIVEIVSAIAIVAVTILGVAERDRRIAERCELMGAVKSGYARDFGYICTMPDGTLKRAP
jgi:hypothetical protein